MTLAFKRAAPLVVLFCSILGLELGCRWYFESHRERFSFANPEQYTISEADLKRITPQFNAKLGWRPNFSTEYGERPRNETFEENFLATFGGSFTYCSEVSDNETWQNYLASMVKKNVFNFGGEGFGIDQSALYFENIGAPPKTKYVMLAMVVEAADGLHNIYRKFGFRKTLFPLTKPRFDLRADGIALVENPIQAVNELVKLKDPSFIHALGQIDKYYLSKNLPRLSFPYLRFLFYPRFWKEILSNNEVNEGAINFDHNPWNSPETAQIFRLILSRFKERVRSIGAEPVFVAIPMKINLERLRKGQKNPGVDEFHSYCANESVMCLDAIQEFAKQTRNQDLDKLGLWKKGWHLSERGNKMLATILAEFLKDKGT